MNKWCGLIGCWCNDVADVIDDDWDVCDMECEGCPDCEDY